MSGERITKTARPFFIASCDDCDWKLASRNALGVAARHTDRERHSTYITIERAVRFTFPDREVKTA